MIRKTIVALAAAATLGAASMIPTAASAGPYGWHGGHHHHHGGWGGPGVGVGIGLGLLGAAAAAGSYGYYNAPYGYYGSPYAYGGECYRTRVMTPYGWRFRTTCY